MKQRTIALFFSLCTSYAISNDTREVASIWIEQSTNRIPKCTDCTSYFKSRPGQYQQSYILQFDQLPTVSYPSNPEWEYLYRVTWEAFLDNIELPDSHIETFPAPRLKTQYSNHDFQWDQAMINLSFGKYAHKSFNTILGLDNFYRFQHDSGFIPRQISPDDNEIVFFPGVSMPYQKGDVKVPERMELVKRLHEQENSANPPLLAAAELHHYRISQNKPRLEQVINSLEELTEWLENNLMITRNELQGLFRLGRAGSGLDNLPLGKGIFEHFVQQAGIQSPSNLETIPQIMRDAQFARVDTSAQMVIHYRAMADIERLLGYHKESKQYKKKADKLAQKINECLWHSEVRFYFDAVGQCVGKASINPHFQRFTLASYWPLYANIATLEQARTMTQYLQHPDYFATELPYPALATSDPDFYKDGDVFSGDWGDYWNGGVWPPLMYVVLKGLQNYPQDSVIWNEVHRASQLYISGLSDTMFEEGEFDENYIDEYKRRIYEYNSPLGGVGKRGHRGGRIEAKKKFVGWGGVGPIALMQEVVIGMVIEETRIVWNLYDPGEDMGISNLKVGDSTFSIHYTANLSSMQPAKEDFNIEVSNASGCDIKTLIVQFREDSNQLETLTIDLTEQ